MDRTYHDPVMTQEVIEILRPVAAGTLVDATFGGGGHTAAMLAAFPEATVLAVDRDPEAAEQALRFANRVRFVPGDFRHLDVLLEEGGFHDLDGALLDIGVSSHQLDTAERGFSYHRAGPLDMRMGPSAPFDADEVVNGWDRDRLAHAIGRFGEERFARRIAGAIVAARPITDTGHLASVVAGAVPAAARRKRHPARRTFQALRIAVNDELAALADGLDAVLRMLRPGGRVVVISYHSLEDRIVKRRFADEARGCVCPPDLPVCGCGRTAGLRVLTRRPLRPGAGEVSSNPRSRSALLRAAERVAT